MGKYIYDAILTLEDDGCYSVEIPALPGCFSRGDSYKDAVFMAADAMKTWIASALSHGETILDYHREYPSENTQVTSIFIEVDEGFIIDGPVVSAAQAARELKVTAGRITQMIDAGILDGYREGRRTFVSEASIKARKLDPKNAGRPKRNQALEA